MGYQQVAASCWQCQVLRQLLIVVLIGALYCWIVFVLLRQKSMTPVSSDLADEFVKVFETQIRARQADKFVDSLVYGGQSSRFVKNPAIRYVHMCASACVCVCVRFHVCALPKLHIVCICILRFGAEFSVLYIFLSLYPRSTINCKKRCGSIWSIFRPWAIIRIGFLY